MLAPFAPKRSGCRPGWRPRYSSSGFGGGHVPTQRGCRCVVEPAQPSPRSAFMWRKGRGKGGGGGVLLAGASCGCSEAPLAQTGNSGGVGLCSCGARSRAERLPSLQSVSGPAPAAPFAAAAAPAARPLRPTLWVGIAWPRPTVTASRRRLHCLPRPPAPPAALRSTPCRYRTSLPRLGLVLSHRVPPLRRALVRGDVSEGVSSLPSSPPPIGSFSWTPVSTKARQCQQRRRRCPPTCCR